jgi:hypothetical protein
VNRNNIWVPQTGDRARFCQEPAGNGFVRGELGVNDLDRDSAVQRGIGGEKHDAHAAPAELALEPVIAAQCCLQCREEIDGGIAHVENR